jgi:trehalose synthase-fused probable maltokinase
VPGWPDSWPSSEALTAWLPRQRWFGAKQRQIKRLIPLDWTRLGGAGQRAVVLGLVEVEYDRGSAERYLLTLRPVGADGAPVDALTDAGCCQTLLAAFDAGLALATLQGGALHFERGPNFATLRPDGSLAARPLGVEQSNSSIVFGQALIMKCFRRFVPGLNPDLEVPRFLVERTTFRQVPRPAGWVEYRGPFAPQAILASLQELLPARGDGWSELLATLANPLRAVSGWAELLDEVDALGRLTADLHLALAADPTDLDFCPEPIRSVDLVGWRAGVLARLARLIVELQRADQRLPPSSRTLAQQVVEGAGRLAGRANAFQTLTPGAASKIRCHGDYHLGQLLRTPAGWVVLDFEGEPLRPLAERRARRSPLVDLAGLLRSLSYLAEVAQRRSPADLAPRLVQWERAAHARLRSAYFARAGSAGFLPADRTAAEALIAAFELEKAAYELEYELANRPDWAEIPLRHLARLAG